MQYLVLFVNTFGRLSFRDKELEALLEMRGIRNPPMRWSRVGVEGDETAFMEIDLPTEEDAVFLGSRSVGIKGIFEPWGAGASVEECLEACRAFPAQRKDPFLAEGGTFKINVVSVGGTISSAERGKLIETCFDYIDFKGKVQMDQTRKGVRAGKGPRADNQFWWLEDVGNPPHVSSSTGLVPHRRWFAREVALSQRPLLERYDLKKREYLCTTSMTAELSFLVANFAHCRPGTLVLDPFCGSASLLISAAHFGSYTMGGDIDIRVIRGKQKDKKMAAHCRFARTLKEVEIGPLSNFRQYGLMPPLDLVRCDSANPVWKVAALFDAIICDPPYGVRAGARRTGTKQETVKPISEEFRDTHIPGTVAYNIADVFIDLLNFAAKFLRAGGRLCYWLPTTREGYCPEDLPAHPCMRLAYNCEDVLSTKLSRRLITMVKEREPAEGETATCAMTEAVCTGERVEGESDEGITE